MIEEAVSHGLRIDDQMFEHLANGMSMPGGAHPYVAPDPRGPLHRSLMKFWWLLELIPKSACWREKRRWSLLGFYLPLGERRLIPQGALVHSSVALRQAGPLEPPYHPSNLPPHGSPPAEGRLGPIARRVVQLAAGLAIVAGLVWLGILLWRHLCLWR